MKQKLEGCPTANVVQVAGSLSRVNCVSFALMDIILGVTMLQSFATGVRLRS